MKPDLTPEVPFDAAIAERFKGPPRPDGGIVSYFGFEIVDAGPGTMHARFEVRDEFLTAFGNMHGGVLSAFCDHLLGCVCYPAMKKGQWAATTEFKINLTAPVSGGVVDGYAEIINLTRSQAVIRIEIVNEGRLAASAQGTSTIRDPR